MTRKLIMLAIVTAVSVLAFTLRPVSTVDRVAYLNAIRTDAVHVFGESRFIGCPNLMHRAAEPFRVAVEAAWSDSLEPLRNSMDPHSFQREHYAAIDWHGNFEKQIE